MHHFFSIIAVIITGITALSSPAAAQSTGTVAGYVTDARGGAPLFGVNVYFESTDMGASSDTNGYYQISSIPTQTYTLVAEYIGYAPQTRVNTIIKSGGNPDMNFQLQSSAYATEEVVVQQSLFEKPAENPLSIREFSQVEIATYPAGNNDIAKVVQSLPGVAASAEGFRNDIIIRGGGPNENVYYLDGIEIPNINHFATQGSAGGPVGLLNVSFFEGVTLSTSSFPARYDNTLSSVLQFNQRQGNARHMQRNLRIGFSEVAATVEGPLFLKSGESYSNTTYMLSVRRSYLQFLFKLIGLPFLPDYWDYQYKVNHKFSNYDEINLVGLGSIDDFRINAPADIDAEQQAQLDQVPIIKQWTTTHGISWIHRFNDFRSQLKTTVSTNVFDNRFSRYRDNNTLAGLYLENNSQERDIKFRSEYSRFYDTWSFSSGLLLQHSVYSTQTDDLVNAAGFSSNLSYLRYGAFGQLTKGWFTSRLSTTFGIRADGNSFTANGNNLARSLSPRAGVSYELSRTNSISLTASAGRYFKIAPNTILGFRNNSGKLVNRDAEYLRSDHLVAGMSWNPGEATQFSIESFLKRYDNYPVSVKDSVSLANLGADFEVFGNEQIKSVGKGRSYGLELTWQRKLDKNWYGLLAYTLYWSEFTGFDRERFLPSFWDNRHLFTFTGGYKLGKSWELGARLRVVGKAPFAPIDREATLRDYPALALDYNNLGDQRLNSLNSLDIRIDKSWNFSGWTFEAYLEVQNTTGSALPSVPAYGLKRDAGGSIVEPRELVEIKQTENGQAIPTIGIVIDF